MKKFFLALLIVVVLSSIFVFTSTSKEKREKRRNLTFAFYNVENLFDTEDDPHKNDNEFLPGNDKNWNKERFHKKLEDISKVLSSINEKELPEVIGLCEVENEKVVSELVHTGKLVDGNYQVVHFDSPDVRGIDCALVFRPDELKLIDKKPFPVKFADKPRQKTRDILYVKVKAQNNEVFHIFVNHWPSRIGGDEETEPDRVFVATVLRGKIDSVLQTNPEANIVVMGDMNDEPANTSLSETLGAKIPGTPGSELINLMYPDDIKELGTYFYRNEWNMLDNLVVSQSLLDKKGFQCKAGKGFIFRQDWMEFKNSKGVASPNRTYSGANYYGGISDHFPVYFQLQR